MTKNVGIKCCANLCFYLIEQLFVPGYENQLEPFQLYQVDHYSTDFAVQWSPLLHCQAQGPPAEQQRVPAGKTGIQHLIK